MLIPKKISTRKILFLVSVLIIILGIISYLLFSNFWKGTLKSLLIVNRSLDFKVTTYPKIQTKLELDLLNENKFKRLKTFGPETIEIEPLGKDNPFYPFD